MYKNFNLKKHVYLLLFISLIISCLNEEMEDLVDLSDPVVEESDPVIVSFIINSGFPTSSQNVTLNSDVIKEGESLEMRFKNPGDNWSDWEAYSSEKSWTLSLGDGMKTVYAEYRDQGSHFVSTLNNITLDTGAPLGTFYIWGSAISGNQHEFINSQTVTLCMNITNVFQ